MKRSTTLLLPVLLLVMASCGTTAQYSQQRFQDEIYAKIGEEPEVVRLLSQKDFENKAAANIAHKQGRDTLVIILDDPWDVAWYSRYNRYHYSPWLWGGLAFGCHYWNRYYGSWYDPFWDNWYGYYGGWYDPWYYSYFDPWYYDPWYGGYGYGWYGHRYGWYDHPSYPGGYWGGGGGSYRGRDVVRTPRATTSVGGSRERRPGSGPNYRYGAPGSSGSTILRSGTNVRPASRARATASASSTSGNTRSSASGGSSTIRTREQGYNPSRTYQNKNSNSSNPTRSGSYNDAARSSSRSSSSSSSYGGGAIRSGSSSSSYGGASRSSGGSYGGGATRSSGGGGGASHSSGNASHSGGGGGARSGGRR